MVKLLDWNVFPQTCTLENSKTGASIKLSPRTMDVLKYLIEAQGKVVSSTELLDRFWSRSISSDHAVHNAIAELRSALGDRASNPRYIKTYPKRGYALIAKPRESESDLRGDQSEISNTRLWSLENYRKGAFFTLLVISIVVAVNFWVQPKTADDIDTHVVLVRQLETINVEASNLFWATQFPSSLVTHLSALPDTVIVSGFGDLAAEEYVQSNFIDEVDFILGGNIQQADGKLRLQIDLINAKENSILFSDQIDISSAQVFDVHDEVGRSIVAALSIYLNESQFAEMQDWGTSNPIAYTNFLEAGFYAGNSNHADLERAIRHYAIAIDEDPAFTSAYIGLIRSASTLGIYSKQQRNAELHAMVKGAISEVARVNSNHEALSEMRDHLLSMQSGNWRVIESTLREQILSGDAGEYTYSRYATLLAEARLYDEAARIFELASDEEAFTIPRRMTWLYQTFFETPQNLIQAQKRILLDRTDHIGIMSALIRGLAFIGDYEDAVYYLERQMAIDEEGPITMLSHATISGISGQSTEAGNAFEQSNLANPEYNLSHGAKSLILGDIGSGIDYWRSLSSADLRRLAAMAHKIEMYFPDSVLADSRYHALLEELDLGITWQRQLMEGVQAMSSVTGVSLNSQSRSHYENYEFLTENNLWDHSQIYYPNRGQILRTPQPENH
jgi:DNA-binding winged helix-turn-helix (wHTH) protein/TolB-like protein